MIEPSHTSRVDIAVKEITLFTLDFMLRCHTAELKEEGDVSDGLEMKMMIRRRRDVTTKEHDITQNDSHILHLQKTQFQIHGRVPHVIVFFLKDPSLVSLIP